MKEEKIYRNYKFRLTLNDETKRLFNRWMGCCRFVYNLALSLTETMYPEVPDRAWNYTRYCNELVYWKEVAPFLKIPPAQALQQALRELDHAFKAYWNHKAGHPSYRRKGESDSFRIAQHFSIDEVNCRIKLPKAGWIRYRKSRKIEGKPKQITVKKHVGHYYAFILCEQVRTIEPKPHLDKAAGIDLGVKVFATLSDGQTYHAPMEKMNKLDQEIRTLQKRLKNKKPGSRRTKELQRRIARKRHRLANIRRDSLHKISRQIAETQSDVFLEDLMIMNMTKSARGTVDNPGRNVKAKAGLNRVMRMQGWGMFRRMLAYKMHETGGRLYVVNSMYTSQTCSRCGFSSDANRRTQARFHCKSCGHVLNADLNAAINILNRGLNDVRAGCARSAREVNLTRGQQREPVEAVVLRETDAVEIHYADVLEEIKLSDTLFYEPTVDYMASYQY